MAQLGSDTTPAYGQVDIIGLVVTIVSSHITTANGLAATCTSIIIMTTSLYRTEKAVDKVYLVDDNEHMIVVKVWDGIQVMCT